METQKQSLSCECTPIVETRFGEDRKRSPSMAIVQAVAAAEGVAPIELDPLHEEIDLGTIDQLFADHGRSSTSQIRFSVCGWNIFIRSGGAIRVCDPDRTTDPTPVFEKPIAD